jgi:hypothetical protein
MHKIPKMMVIVKNEMGEMGMGLFFNSTEYRAQEAMDTRIKRSPGLKANPINKAKEPLEIMTITPQREIRMPRVWSAFGLFWSKSQAKPRVMAGIAATTMAILVAVVYRAPIYKTEL